MLATKQLLAAFAYALLMAATVPLLAAHAEVSWGMLPLWLIMTGYTASVLKNLSSEEDQAKRYLHVVWLSWFTYYTIALVWPLPMHWYDSFAVLALVSAPDSLMGGVLMTGYYLLTTASYAEKGNALQVSGRGILLVLSAIATKHAYDQHVAAAAAAKAAEATEAAQAAGAYT